MTPVVKYTLARFGMLGVVFLALLPVPEVLGLSLFTKALLALAITMPLSWFLLRRWRDEMAKNLAEASKRRRARSEALRAVLAGDTDADRDGAAGTTSTGTSGAAAGEVEADGASADTGAGGTAGGTAADTGAGSDSAGTGAASDAQGEDRQT